MLPRRRPLPELPAKLSTFVSPYPAVTLRPTDPCRGMKIYSSLDNFINLFACAHCEHLVCSSRNGFPSLNIAPCAIFGCKSLTNTCGLIYPSARANWKDQIGKLFDNCHALSVSVPSLNKVFQYPVKLLRNESQKGRQISNTIENISKTVCTSVPSIGCC